MYFLLTFLCVSELGIAFASPTNLEKYVDHQQPSLTIINGEETAESEARYFVTVIAYDDQVSKKVVEFCGGSILSERYILTAAHCMEGVGYYEVIAGTHLLYGRNRVVIGGTKYSIHSQYAPAPIVHHDIATLMLKTPLDFSNPRIRPVRLPTWSEANATYVGVSGRIFGRGKVRTSQADTDYTEELRYVIAEVITNAECKNDFAPVWDGNMCTSGLDRGVRIGGCFGDSGGPFIYLDTQIGLVSYGEDVCEAAKPTVFTDLGQYLDWIEKNSDVVIRR